MSGRITLHPEHGVNPSLEKRICPIEMREYESGNLLMLGRNKGKEAEKYTTTGYETCPDCKAKLAEGYIALVCIDEAQSGSPMSNGNMKQEDVHRTGTIMWLKRKVANDIFNVPLDSKLEMIFIDEEVADMLKSKMPEEDK